MEGKIKELKNSEIEIEAKIPAKDFDGYRKRAVESLGKKVSVDGFREGKIPENILVQKIGEMAILEETAEIAIRNDYPKFVIAEKLEVLGRPEISITKIAVGNDLEFKIKTAIMPRFKLNDYKSSAKKVISSLSKESTDVSDEEINKVLEEVRKMRGTKHEHKCEDAECKHDETSPGLVGLGPKAEKVELPELNDEFAKTLGEFKDLADLKSKIKGNLKMEKEVAKRDKTRMQIIDVLSNETEINPPKILVDEEISQIVGEIKGRMEQSGMKFEKYLEQVKKTLDEIKKEAEDSAKKRVKFKLILRAIADAEKIKADEKEAAEEVKKILEFYKKADPDSVKIYVEDMLTNEAVFNFLES